ncbi:uncharacterized protein RCC_09718 [Ramularia collo-cygni]|uniref:CsbD-like domain-containing protein n=1 Tax=Ramularia collo-cygni TaxID=112498 RepID=A0A2D3VI91_9PEZI|nr:uncharacterized protein RCC_09718 [Ramularia collo-cygni]CZT24001.1 uncharacterized protein RCC_09718 [Ramularia collo-cygni]
MSGQNNGAEGVAKGVTSTLGNLTGGVLKGVGSVTGAAGRAVGETVNNTTGTKAVGDSLQYVTGGVEGAGQTAGKGLEDVGQWKKP